MTERSAVLDDATMKVGLLMESAQAHQKLAEGQLERLRAHTQDLDSVVRDEIRRTLVEELRALTRKLPVPPAHCKRSEVSARCAAPLGASQPHFSALWLRSASHAGHCRRPPKSPACARAATSSRQISQSWSSKAAVSIGAAAETAGGCVFA
jgi:hypothetical protein